MKYSFVRALPYLLGFAAAVVQALLVHLQTISVSTPNQIAVVMAAKVIGDYIRSQILIAQAKYPEPQAGVLAVATLQPRPTIDSDLVRQVVEERIRASLAKDPIGVEATDLPSVQ